MISQSCLIWQSPKYFQFEFLGSKSYTLIRRHNWNYPLGGTEAEIANKQLFICVCVLQGIVVSSFLNVFYSFDLLLMSAGGMQTVSLVLFLALLPIIQVSCQCFPCSCIAIMSLAPWLYLRKHYEQIK